MVELTAEEQRVLGCLIEKEATTPDQYPLTMNSLLLACNQSTNRDPVVLYDQDTVTKALTTLRENQLTRVVYPAHARATKYRHVLGEVWALTEQELAVLAVLMLRGPQTGSELRARTDRYASFDDLGGVEGVLDRLGSRPEPMVVRLERQPGQREERFAQLLGGAVEAAPWTPPAPSAARAGSALEALQAEVAALRAEVDSLQEAVNHLLGR
ncbi:MAG TPA: YceH family protein [Acidimicrobiales bacterium]|nr:YceH family protein [Acidimicrobiales bacterium]